MIVGTIIGVLDCRLEEKRSRRSGKQKSVTTAPHYERHVWGPHVGHQETGSHPAGATRDRDADGVELGVLLGWGPCSVSL